MKDKTKKEEEIVADPCRTNPRTRSTMPEKINLALRIVSSFCPVCGDCVQDKRFKRRCTGPTLFTRRFTDTGITRECRCGLRFYFTWRTFVNVMKKKLKTERDEKMKEWLKLWIIMIENYFGLNDELQLAKIEALRKRSRKAS